MDSPPLLGIDVGTSLTKVGIFTPEGQPLALQSATTPIVHEGPECATHDPQALWRTTANLIRQALEQLRQTRPNHAPIAAIGIASFGESGVLLGADGQIHGPLLAWFDARPKAQALRLSAQLDVQALRQRTGLRLDHTYSLCKLLWLRDQLERGLHKLTWLSVADWIAFQLTGIKQSGLTQASRTLLFDLHERCWLEAVLETVDLPSSLLPPLRHPGETIGAVHARAAAETGLALGTPVLEASHDQPAAAAGVGATKPGVLLNACGTAEVLFSTLEPAGLSRALEHPGVAVGHHALPDRLWALSTLRAAGSVIDWFIRSHSLEAPTEIPSSLHRRLVALAMNVPFGAGGVRFLPHLRNLSEDPNAPQLPGGVFWGLREAHGVQELARAMLEGLACESAWLLERIEGAIGVLPEDTRIVAVGGPTRNPVLMQLKADLCQRSFDVHDAPNASTWGAAWLAWSHLHHGQVAPPVGAIERSHHPEISASDSRAFRQGQHDLVSRLAR